MKPNEREIDGFKIHIFKLGDYLVGVARSIGPRVLYFGRSRDKDCNVFGIVPDFKIKTEEGVWKIYGGHRLWSSPEATPRSYSLDNKPVEVETSRNTITIYGHPEQANSIQKEINMRPSGTNYLQVTHTITNIGRWEIRLACWALTVMKKGGFAVVPLPPAKQDKMGLLPDRRLSLWPYTNLSDKRFLMRGNHLLVKQDPTDEKPFKIGVMTTLPWAAYVVDNLSFVKKFRPEQAEYPDFGCNVEVYTNSQILELETLSPLKTIKPGESITHVEFWGIFDVRGLTPESKRINLKIPS